MHWLYYFPGGWDDPAKPTLAADLWLIPEAAAGPRQSLRVSVRADAPPPGAPSARVLLRPPDPDDYRVSGGEITVRAAGIARDEVVAWARLWLHESGYGHPGLVEGSWEDFAGTNAEAILVDAIGYLLVSLEHLRSLPETLPLPPRQDEGARVD